MFNNWRVVWLQDRYLWSLLWDLFLFSVIGPLPVVVSVSGPIPVVSVMGPLLLCLSWDHYLSTCGICFRTTTRLLSVTRCHGTITCGLSHMTVTRPVSGPLPVASDSQ